MSSSQTLAGPVWWFLVGTLLLAVGLALFVVADGTRRLARARRGAEGVTGRDPLGYVIVEGVFLVIGLVAQVPGTPREIGAVVAVGIPIALVVGTAYLLRIVFPTRARPAAPSEGPFDDGTLGEGF